MFLALPPAASAATVPVRLADEGKRESLEEFLARARAKQAALFAELTARLEAIVKRIEALTLPANNAAREGLIDECVALGADATPLLVRWIDPGAAALEKEQFRAKQIAAALARMDTRAATTELLDVVTKGSTDGRLLAARVLETSTEGERIKPVLLAVYRESEGALRGTLLRSLLRLAPDDPALMDEVLAGEDDALRDVVLRVLADTKNAAAEAKVHRLLTDPQRAGPHALAILAYYQALPELADTAHVKALIALASNSQVPVATRIAIVDALPTFVSATSNDLRKALEPLVGGSETKLSESAQVVLAKLGDRVAKRELLKPYDDVVDNVPGWSQGYFRRAEILRRIADYKDAEKDYQKALALGKNDSSPQPDTYIGLARCAALQGHLKEAAQHLQKAPISLARLRELASDPDFAKLKASKQYGDVFPKD